MHMAPLQALVTVVVLLLAPTLVVGSSAKEAPSAVYRSDELIHVDANNGGNSTKDELVASSASDTDTYLETARYSHKEYLMELRIGTPPKTFNAVADTGSDVIWTRRTDLMCSSASTSFAKMVCSNPDNKDDCVFNKSYGGSKMGAEGFMALDVLTLSRTAGLPDKEVRISFGCATTCHDDKGDADCHRLIPKSADGVVGLNRAPNSLRAQLSATKFSYCLSDPAENEQIISPIWFGGGDLELRNPPWWLFWRPDDVQETPLVKTSAEPPSVWAYKYYVELEGISVGKKSAVLKLPNENGPHQFKQKSLDGDKAAMVLDSGCSYTHLEAAAFDPLTELLAKKLKAQVFLKPPASPDTDKKQDSKTCFRAQRPRRRPDVVLHLRGGAKMHLRWSTYMTQQGNEPEFCINIVNSSSKSILGNIHQQNMHMLYDLRAEKLSFLPVPDCSKREL